MVSEKIQEVEKHLNTLTKDMDGYYDKIISLTKTFIDDWGKIFDIDTKEIHDDCDNAISALFENFNQKNIWNTILHF